MISNTHNPASPKTEPNSDFKPCHNFSNAEFTLAAAYAEDSGFDEAISTAQLACSLIAATGQADQFGKNQALLELFRSQQPYHAASR